MSSPSRQQAPASVIHDLGYRGYEGRRTGRAGVLGYLVRQGFASTFGMGRTWKGKVMPWVCVALMVFPMVISGAILVLIPADAFGEGPMDPIFHPARVPYAFFTLVALFAAVAAPVLFSADLRSRAIVHYLSRPLLPSDYVLARLASLVLALWSLQGAGVLIGTLGWWLGGGRASTVWGAFAVGLLGALLTSIVVAVITGLVAALTPKRGVATAVSLGVLLLLSAVSSVLFQVLEDTGHQRGLVARWAPLLSPATSVERVVRWATGNQQLTAALDSATAVGILVVLVLGCVLGVFLLLRRYRGVS